MNDKQDSRFISIPLKVVSDRRLTPNAKIIYGELYTLADTNGECYPSNKHFEKLLGLKKSQTSRIIKELKQYEYLETRYLEDNNRVVRLNGIPIPKNRNTSSTKMADPYSEKVDSHIYKQTNLEIQKGKSNPDINFCMEILRKANGSLTKVQLNRFALKRMLATKGRERVVELFNFAVSLRGIQYKPQVKNFMDLEDKWVMVEIHEKEHKKSLPKPKSNPVEYEIQDPDDYMPQTMAVKEPI